jgi:hypothetical protein
MLQSCALEALGVPELPPRGAHATPTPCGDAPGMDAAGGRAAGHGVERRGSALQRKKYEV